MAQFSGALQWCSSVVELHVNSMEQGSTFIYVRIRGYLFSPISISLYRKI